MTVCRLQSAQTDDRTQFYIHFFIFKVPQDYVYRESKNNNSNLYDAVIMFKAWLKFIWFMQ